MSIVRLLVSLLAASLLTATISVAFSQGYPSKPIRIIATPAGGFGDLSARMIGQGISGPLGQPVVIENHPANLIGGIVSKAPPDGYTLQFSGQSFMFAPLLRPMPYDVVKDFSPITLVTTSINIIVVHPSLPVKSIKELIALAKARPGQLNNSVTSIGGSTHLAGELFKAMAGVNIVAVNYKGATAGHNGLMMGEVQVHFTDMAAWPYVKAGKMRALAVTSPQPSLLAPGLPTVAATGLPGYEMVGIDGIWAPAGTPAATVTRLNQEIVRVIKSAEVKEKFFNLGGEVVGSSPEEFGVKIKSDIATMGKVIKDAGIKIE